MHFKSTLMAALLAASALSFAACSHSSEDSNQPIPGLPGTKPVPQPPTPPQNPPSTAPQTPSNPDSPSNPNGPNGPGTPKTPSAPNKPDPRKPGEKGPRMQHRTGSDGIEFQTLPSNIEDGCGAIILKGTNRFRGTAFLMPKGYVAIDAQDNILADILETPDGGFILQVALYFPNTGEDMRTRRKQETSFAFRASCGMDSIKQRLNEGVTNNADMVTQLGALPVNNISVSVDGVERPYLIGDRMTQLLDYQGHNIVAQFRIKNATDMRAIANRILSPSGLQLRMDVSFTARSTQDVTTVDIKTSELLDSLKAKLGASVFVADISLNTAITESVRNMDLDIYGEGDVNEALVQVGEQVFQKLVTDGLKPVDPSTIPDKGSNPVPGAKWFSVEAVYERVRAQTNISLSFMRMGEKQNNKYSTSVVLQGQINTPDSQEKSLSSIEPGTAIPVWIDKGMQMAITPLFKEKHAIVYKRHSRFFSSSELPSLNLARFFPKLAWERKHFGELDTNTGKIAYLWEEKFSLIPTGPNESLFGMFNHSYFVWGKYEYMPVDKLLSSVDTTCTSENISKLPIAVTFSLVGGVYKLGDLGRDTEYWTGRFDNNNQKLLFQAKQDLGQMTLVNFEQNKSAYFDLSGFFEQKWNGSGEIVSTREEGKRFDTVPTEKSVIRVRVTTGDAPLSKQLGNNPAYLQPAKEWNDLRPSMSGRWGRP